MKPFPLDFEHLLVVDVEATCCDQGSIERPDIEIIEIGAVMVETASMTQVSEFSTFVKPVVHAQLTPFCTKLTSIRQMDVDQAPLYSEAIQHLTEWMRDYSNCAFCSWGNYDRYQFQYDCERNQTPYPFGDVHFNLKAMFHKNQAIKKRCSVSTAMKFAEIEFEGTPHRGIDDARNIAKLLRMCCPSNEAKP
jgi:inhibitor of KinA sporulation pathway (predicted exonuclease)